MPVPGTDSGFSYRILVVDDEESIRSTSTAILTQLGYEVRTAADGFAALVELRRSPPDIIISDLRMPNMSGFEFLSVVRRRFPHIAVIAISGEYNGSEPAGLIADAFFTKGHYAPEQLFKEIAGLLEQSPLRPHVGKPDRAPVWVPKSNTGYIILTCLECLRSFSVPFDRSSAEPQETECAFCDAKVWYICDLNDIKSKARSTTEQRKRA
jgi:CheY-like chemotaxis protein